MKLLTLALLLLLSIGSYASKFYLYTNKVFTKGETTSVAFYSNEYNRRDLKRKNLDVIVYQVQNPKTFFTKKVLNQNSLNVADDEVKQMKLIKSWQTDVNRGSYSRSITIGSLEPGLYIVEGILDGEISRVPLVVTSYSIITKNMKSSLVGFVSDNIKGREQVGFQFVAYKGTKIIRPSAENGSLVKFNVPQEQQSNYNMPIIAFRGDEIAISNAYYSQYYYNNSPEFKKYTFTDRSAYRPEQMVKFKGIVRKKSGFNYKVARDTVYYTITDPQNTEVYSGKARLDNDGAFVDSMQLGVNNKLGTYTINVSLQNTPNNNYYWWGYGNEQKCTFLVEEYKKPEFDVKVNMEKSQYVSGDKLIGSVTADYFFGAPVTNATVDYKVMKERYHVPWYYNYAYSWWYEEWYGGYYTSNKEIVHTGSGKINSDGEFEIDYQTSDEDAFNYKYTVIAEVKDASRRTISGTSTTMVAYSEYTLSCNAAKYYYEPGENIEVNISTADLAKEPVSANVIVKFYKDHSKTEKNLVQKISAKTNQETGTVEAITQISKPGYYYVDVIGTDSKGREIISSCNVYILKSGDYRYSWWNQNSGNINIMTDKKVYMAGDRVKAMVYIPHEADALVTINGEQLSNYTIYSFRKVADSTSGVVREIEFRLKDNTYGNVEVSLAYFQNGNFYQKAEKLTVIPDNRYLDVSLSFDEDEYKPGNTATGTIVIKDSKGDIVPNTNVTLSTADESIYFLYPDQTKDIKKVFYESTRSSANFSYQGNINHTTHSKLLSPEELKWRVDRFDLKLDRWNYLDKDQWHRIIYEGRSEQKMPNIRGYAVDYRTGEVIPGVKVTCNGKTAITDKDGFYLISKINKTYTTVEFSFNGQSTTIKNINTSLWSDIGLSAAISGSKSKEVELVENPEIYTYSWAVVDSTMSLNTGLSTGSYTITVSDANGSTVNQPISISNSEIGFFTANGAADGSVMLGVTGGVAANFADMTTATWDFEGGDAMLNLRGEKLDYGGKYKAEVKVVEAKIRSDFKDAIYWNPNIRTDENGRAKVKIKLPDNLTTWRTNAKVITRDGKVGQSMAKITVKKNLLVRMETPRFMKVGDELLIATNIHNYLSTDKQVRVQLMSNGVVVYGTEKTITVKSNDEARVDWKVEANWIRDAKFTVQALTDEESDAMTRTVPVMPNGLEMVEAQNLIVTNGSSKEIQLRIPDSTDLNTASMEISLAPSITATLLSSMDDLIGYPYGCVEQTMSRFLPNVIVANTIKDLDNVQLNVGEGELAKMVAKGVKRLGELQHNDGGWGWWENDETHPFMTAYVVNGLYQATTAGYEIDPGILERGEESLISLIGSEKGNSTTYAYMQMVAAKAGLKTWKTPKSSDFKNAYEIALWAQAAHYAGEQDAAQAYMNKLLSQASKEAGLCFWGGKKFYYSWQEDNVETTANAVKAMLLIDPDHEQIPAAVQWLMNQKKGNSWHNTRQTAMTIYALQELIKQELNPNIEVDVFANGSLIYSKKFNSSNANTKGNLIVLKGEDFTAANQTIGDSKAILKNGLNSIRVVQKGKGRSYTSAKLKYFLEGVNEFTEEQKANQAFTVKRQYYKLVEKKTEHGIVYQKTKADFNNIMSGDNILVKVSLHSKAKREFVLVEDPIPAGCEFIRDPQGFVIEGESNYSSAGSYWNNSSWGYWNWNRWYSHQEYRDSKYATTITTLPKGDYSYTYLMKAQIPGTYKLTPAVAQLMYYPEIRGFSDFQEFKILNDNNH